MRSVLSIISCVLAIVLAVPALSAEPDVSAEEGEKRITGEAADTVLSSLQANFLKRPCVRAEIVSITNDPLLGAEKERGEMLLQIPQRFLRRFGPKDKPVKAWLLDGEAVRESNTAQKTVNELDFTKAPKKLALLRAAITMDADVLKDYFHLALFKKGEGENAAWRLVLSRREDVKNPIDYKRIQARWEEGAPFFSEIVRVPKTGEEDRAVETFSKLQVVEKFTDADFKEPLLERKVVSKAIKD